MVVRDNRRGNKIRLIETEPKAPIGPLPNLWYNVGVADRRTSQPLDLSMKMIFTIFRREFSANNSIERGWSNLEVATEEFLRVALPFATSGNGPLTEQSVKEDYSFMVSKLVSRRLGMELLSD